MSSAAIQDELVTVPPAVSHGFVEHVRVGPRSHQWHVAAKPHVMLRLKRVFPRVRMDSTGVAVITDTTEVARDLEWFLDRYPMEVSPAARRALRAGADRHRDVEDTVAAILAGRYDRPSGMLTPAQESRPYQLVAADLVTVKRRTLITDALGLGKTHEGALTFRNPGALPGLVVCPTQLTQQWLQKLTEEIWPDLTVYVPKKGSPDQHFERWVKNNDDRQPDLYVMPYSKLDGWRHHLAGAVQSVVFDEAHELRNGQETLRGVAARNIGDNARYVVGMTATPVTNYASDLHNMLDIVSPGSLGSRDEFLREWRSKRIATPGGKWRAVVENPKALAAYLREEGLMIGRTREQVGRELPYGPAQKIAQIVPTDADVLAKMEGDAVELARFILAQGQDNRQQFTAAGRLESLLRQETGIAKAPFVAEFVRSLIESESANKVVLWGWHHAVYDLWMESLEKAGVKTVLYSGRQSVGQKNAALDSFKRAERAGGAQVLVMSIKSGAGIDGLQEVCHTGVFGELEWSQKFHDQCAGRLARDGQNSEVLTYYLTAEEGSDPVIAEKLGLKAAQAAPFEDPDSAVVTTLPDDASKGKALARAILAKNQRPRERQN